jgi:hypothetical protein
LVKKQKRALDSGGFMGGERGGVQGLWIFSEKGNNLYVIVLFIENNRFTRNIKINIFVDNIWIYNLGFIQFYA